jgi:hypothetical protein
MKAWVAALAAISMNASWAGLGGAPAHNGPRARAAQAQPGPGAAASYTDLERKLDSGTTVREYVDANGTVFAVSWSGPYLPDLKELLGVHFEEMVAHAAKTQRAGRSQLVLKRSDLVVVSGGHMGAFQGRAWLPGSLPAGFTPDEIQ